MRRETCDLSHPLLTSVLIVTLLLTSVVLAGIPPKEPRLLPLPPDIPIGFSPSNSPHIKKRYPKLESALARFLDIYSTRGATEAGDYARIRGITIENNRVLVELYFRPGRMAEELPMEQLERYRASVASRSKHFIILWVPIEQLAEFARGLKSVLQVHRPRRPDSETVSEGVEVVGAEGFHDAGVYGAGAKVAIVDQGFGRFEEVQDEGELPEDLIVRNFSIEHIRFGGIHGTACAEIVYDMAPEAEITLAKIIWSSDLENAIRYLIDERITAASMSLAWRNPVGDYYRGNDPISRMMNHAAGNGVLFVVSAGNAAKAHYRAEFDDRDHDDDFHRFTITRRVNHFGPSEREAFILNENEWISVYLSWDDFPESGQDYDLLLVHYIEEEEEWEFVDESTGEQNGDDPPVESIFYEVQEAGGYGVIVHNCEADDGIDFTLFARSDLGINTPEGSVCIPAIAEGSFAAGATNFRDWDDEDAEPEDFSSRGPTYDGRMKPDISAPDGTTSSTYDGSFYGTSASAPHVAGAAALIVSAHRDLGSAELREILETQAVDVGEEGPDNLFGHGLLNIELEMDRDPPQIWTDPDGEGEIAADIALNQYYLENALIIGNEAEDGARYLHYTLLTRTPDDDDDNLNSRGTRRSQSPTNRVRRSSEQSVIRRNDHRRYVGNGPGLSPVRSSGSNDEPNDAVRPPPGSSRDDGGDIAREYEVPYRETLDLAWDGELMWGVSFNEWEEGNHLIALDPEDGEITDDFDLPEDAARVTFDGDNLWVAIWGANSIRLYSRDGEVVEEFDSPVEYPGGLACDRQSYIYISAWADQGGRIYVLSMESRELVTVINYLDATGGAEIGGLTCLPDQDRLLWGLIEDGAILLSLDDEWNTRRISSISLNNGRDNGIGLSRDGVQLWRGSGPEDRGRWVVHDDEDVSIPWLTPDPRTGYVPPGCEVEITLLFDPCQLEEDADYRGDLVIRSNDPENSEFCVPLALRTTRPEYIMRIVPDEYETIQDAINSAWRGDTVLVQPGEYIENINFIGKEITVGSLYMTTGDEAYKSETIIDGDRGGSVVTFESGEGPGAVLEGFTIRNGSGIRPEWSTYGGGIACLHNSTPTLKTLVIVGNRATYGGGIYSRGWSRQVMESLEIRDNYAIYGGGIFVQHGRYEFGNIAILRNRADMSGGGIQIDAGAQAWLLNVTVSGNNAGSGGGILLRDSCRAQLQNAIIWDNTRDEIAFSGRDNPDYIAISYSDIMEGEDGVNTNNCGEVEWGDGNIADDPLFVEPESGNWRLTPNSPCIDTGSPEIEDPDGSRSDMGAYYFRQAPEMILQPDSLCFGEVLVERDSVMLINIANVGRLDLHITEISVTGDYFTAPFEEELVIGPNEETRVVVTFAPEEEGIFEGQVTITSNAFEREVAILPLSGLGLVLHPPEIAQPIDDIELAEDFERYRIADLDEVFSDPNGDDLIFSAESGDENLVQEIDEENCLWLSTSPNWFGEVEVTVVADDQTGIVGAKFNFAPTARQLRYNLPRRNIRHILGSDNQPARDLTADLTFLVTVIPVNDAPELLVPIGDKEFDEDSGPWEFADLDTVFVDVDGDELEYSVELPEMLDWDLDEENLLSISAADNLNGDEILIRVIADDGLGEMAQVRPRMWRRTSSLAGALGPMRSIRRVNREPNCPRRDDTAFDLVLLRITPVNDAPFWVDPPEDVEILEGEEVEFTLTAGDVDLEYEGDELELILLNDAGTSGRGAGFNDNGDGTCLYTWQTGFDDEGIYDLVFAVSDGDVAARLEVTLIVRHSNQPPELIRPIEDTEVEEDCGAFEVADLSLVFTDPDGDDLEFGAGAPDGLAVQIMDGILTIEPDRNWYGSASVSITASDGLDSEIDSFTVLVNAVNDAPEIVQHIEDVEIDEDPDRVDVADLDEVFSDPEGDSLSFEIAEAPPQLNMGIDIEWNFLFFDPQPNFNIPEGAGITLCAIEHPAGLATDLTFQVVINPVDDPPSAFNLLWPEDGFEVEREDYLVTFVWEEAVEVDGEDVTYRLFSHVTYEGLDTTVSRGDIDTIRFSGRLDSLLFDLGFEETGEDIRVDAIWWVEASDGLTSRESDERWRITIPVPNSIPGDSPDLPIEFRLTQNYPNPFNSSTSLRFALPRPSNVRLSVWDLSGRLLDVIIATRLPAGWHSAIWTTRNLPTGVYIFTLDAEGRIFVTKGVSVR